METSSTSPHLDDEALSAALDADLGALAPDEDAAVHLGACTECARRRAALAAARAALAAAPAEALDELTRRRLVTAALAEAPGTASVGTRRRRYLGPALAGSVAAALLAVLATASFLTDPTGNREETAGQAVGEPRFLGDLGDLSDPSLVRSHFRNRDGGGVAALKTGGPRNLSEDAVASGDEESAGRAGGAPPSPDTAAPAENFTAPASGGRPPVGSDRAEADTRRFGAGGGPEGPEATDLCVAVLAGGPARNGRFVASAIGVYRGIPAAVATFVAGSLETAYVVARDDCRLLDSYPL